MNAQNFCYWLQGFVEVADKAPNQREWQVILDHLKIVDDLRLPHTASLGISSATPIQLINRGETKYC